jgi:(1->4)-alpha-D-glucan 1-alpha-D-glucosylmutase
LIKIGSPGVADFYQGSELWDFRLVDPDNRGLVDFAHRIELLQGLQRERTGSPEELIRDLNVNWHDGRLKLFLTQKAVRWRREHSMLFQEGEFLPLHVTGSHSQNLVSFIRRREGKLVLVAAPRWISRPSSEQEGGRFEPAGKDLIWKGLDWKDTEILLPPGSPSNWESILSDTTVQLENSADRQSFKADSLFRDFPVAFLHADN